MPLFQADKASASTRHPRRDRRQSAHAGLNYCNPYDTNILIRKYSKSQTAKAQSSPRRLQPSACRGADCATHWVARTLLRSSCLLLFPRAGGNLIQTRPTRLNDFLLQRSRAGRAWFARPGAVARGNSRGLAGCQPTEYALFGGRATCRALYRIEPYLS